MLGAAVVDARTYLASGGGFQPTELTFTPGPNANASVSSAVTFEVAFEPSEVGMLVLTVFVVLIDAQGQVLHQHQTVIGG